MLVHHVAADLDEATGLQRRRHMGFDPAGQAICRLGAPSHDVRIRDDRRQRCGHGALVDVVAELHSQRAHRNSIVRRQLPDPEAHCGLRSCHTCSDG